MNDTQEEYQEIKPVHPRGRDPITGQFAKENRLGRGTVARLTPEQKNKAVELMDQAVSDAEWIELFKQAYIYAMRGHAQYLKIILAYRFGEPPETITMTHTGEIGIVAKQQYMPALTKIYGEADITDAKLITVGNGGPTESISWPPAGK